MHVWLEICRLISLDWDSYYLEQAGKNYFHFKTKLCVQFVTCNDCLGQQQKRLSKYLTNLWSLAMFSVASTVQAGQVPEFAMRFVRRLARVSLAVLNLPCLLKSTNFLNRKSGCKLRREKKKRLLNPCFVQLLYVTVSQAWLTGT